MSTCSISCWGCYKTEVHTCQSIVDHDKKMEEMKKKGWRRRVFSPTASPWFCSKDCATTSPNAVMAAHLWKTDHLDKWLKVLFFVFLLCGAIGLIEILR